jgi:molybdate transport system substrate-binding protein
MKQTIRTKLSVALRCVVGAIAIIATSPVLAEKVNVAVAANFTAAMKEIVPHFEKATGHQAVVSYGSTGKLYAQIKNGAPFGLFLAADVARPELLEKEGKTEAGSRFTYAIGKLVLWSPDESQVTKGGDSIDVNDNGKIAIANPKTAPYGAAAQEVMERLGVWEQVKSRLVKGDSISQTHQFVGSGNVPMGFIALAQVALLPEDGAGSRWMVPDELYTPLEQQAVLLEKGIDNKAARELHSYLQGETAREIIERYGYGLN